MSCISKALIVSATVATIAHGAAEEDSSLIVHGTPEPDTNGAAELRLPLRFTNKDTYNLAYDDPKDVTDLLCSPNQNYHQSHEDTMVIFRKDQETGNLVITYDDVENGHLFHNKLVVRKNQVCEIMFVSPKEKRWHYYYAFEEKPYHYDAVHDWYKVKILGEHHQAPGTSRWLRPIEASANDVIFKLAVREGGDNSHYTLFSNWLVEQGFFNLVREDLKYRLPLTTSQLWDTRDSESCGSEPLLSDAEDNETHAEWMERMRSIHETHDEWMTGIRKLLDETKRELELCDDADHPERLSEPSEDHETHAEYMKRMREFLDMTERELKQ